MGELSEEELLGIQRELRGLRDKDVSHEEAKAAIASITERLLADDRIEEQDIPKVALSAAGRPRAGLAMEEEIFEEEVVSSEAADIPPRVEEDTTGMTADTPAPLLEETRSIGKVVAVPTVEEETQPPKPTRVGRKFKSFPPIALMYKRALPPKHPGEITALDQDYNIEGPEDYEPLEVSPDHFTQEVPARDMAAKATLLDQDPEASPDAIMLEYDRALEKIRFSKEDFQQELAREAHEENQQLRESLLLDLTPEEIRQSQEDIEVLLKEIDVEDRSPLAGKIFLARRAFPNATTNDIGLLVLQSEIQDGIEELVNEEDYIRQKKAYDFGAWLLIWGMRNFQTAGTVFGPDGIEKFKELPLSEQIRQIPFLFEEAREISDLGFGYGENRLRAREYLESFLYSEGSTDAFNRNVLSGVSGAWLGGSLAAHLGRSGGLIRNLYTLGSKREAAALDLAAALDREAAELVATDSHTAAVNMTPYSMKHVDLSYVDHMHKEVLEAAQGRSIEGYEKTRQAALEILGENSGIFPSVEVNVESAMKAWNNGLKEAQILLDRELAETPGDIGTVFPYVASDGRPGWRIAAVDELGNIVKNEHIIFKPTISDVTGQWELPRIAVGKRGTFSPAGSLGEHFGDLLNAGALSVAQTGRLSVEFQQLLKEATAPITGGRFNIRQQHQVARALLMGDEQEKVFTRSELLGGITDTESGKLMVFNDNQIESYFRWRAIADGLYQIEDLMLISQMAGQGLKKINYFSEGEIYGKPIAQVKAQNFLNDVLSKGATVFDPEAKRSLDPTILKREMDKLYGEGKVLIDLRPWREVRSGKSRFEEYLLVDRAKVGELPPRGVKDFRVSYVPKVNKGIEYVVKLHKDSKTSGIARVGRDSPDATVRMTFSSQKRAQAFTDSFNALLKRQGVKDQVYVLHDEVEPFQIGDIPVGTSGKLFNGARTKEQLLLDGRKVEREGAFDALSRNTEFVSKTFPMHEVKLQLQKKFINSVNEELKNTGLIHSKAGNQGRIMKDFNEPLGGDPNLVRSTEYLRNYIRSILSMPTESERTWEITTRKIANFIDDRRGIPDAARKGVMWLSHKDPVAAMRGVTFHAALGILNPTQMVVQAQIASVAASIHPVFGAKAALKALPVVATLFTRNQTVVNRIFKAHEKAGVPIAGLANDIEQMKRSGLFDSLKLTGDHNAAIQNFGGTAAGIRRMADVGLLPYKIGETYGRTVAWLVAKDTWLKRNKGKPLNDKAYEEIFKMQQELTLQMSNANTSPWQVHPLTSFGGQFMHVQTKFMEHLIPKEIGGRSTFGPAEKVRLIIGQGMVYGAAGVVGLTQLVNRVAEQAGITRDEVTPEMLDAVKGGLLSWATGGELAISPRGAIANEIFEMMLGAFTNETLIAEAFFGATGSLVATELRAMRTFLDLAAVPDPTATDFLTYGSEMLNFVSSIRNLRAGLFMMRDQDSYMKRNGIVVPFQFTPFQAYAKAFGISPQNLADQWAQLENEQDVTAKYSAIADRIIKGQALIMSGNEPEEANAKEQGFLLNMLGPYNDQQRFKILSIVAGKVKTGATAEANMIKSAIMTELLGGDILTEGAILNRADKARSELLEQVQEEQE